MFDSNMNNITMWSGKNGNMICRPVQGEFRLFEVRIRGVGLYMHVVLVMLQILEY